MELAVAVRPAKRCTDRTLRVAPRPIAFDAEYKLRVWNLPVRAQCRATDNALATKIAAVIEDVRRHLRSADLAADVNACPIHGRRRRKRHCFDRLICGYGRKSADRKNARKH